MAILRVAFTPKGGCPLKQKLDARVLLMQHAVAFTPKGGCPLKLYSRRGYRFVALLVAFTPKGGCPLKPDGDGITATERFRSRVAFTPKGGCPLKRLLG